MIVTVDGEYLTRQNVEIKSQEQKVMGEINLTKKKKELKKQERLMKIIIIYPSTPEHLTP